MNRTFLAACLAGVLLAGQASAQPAAPGGTMLFATPQMQSSQSEIVRRALASVVNVTIRKRGARAMGAQNAASDRGDTRVSGSGFVIDPSGIIATNYHVVEDALEIEVGFYDGTRVSGRLLKATRLIDIAVIKVEVDHPLPAITWADSDKLQVGDPVLAIGNALGLGISVSGGLVSALNRDIMGSPYDDYIQTDAAINHGNSGGPLFNMQGEVVGIDTALISPTSGSSGVGFAIPSRSARTVIDRLQNYGWLRPGWIGVKIQQVTPDMAQALGMKRADGSIVAYLMPDGPGLEAGLRVGDVVLRVDGSVPSDERALLRTIATTPIGQSLTFGLWRDGGEHDVTVPVREWPRSQWDTFDVPDSMEAPHHHVAANLGIGVSSGAAGVVVTAVEAGSDASERGIEPGDTIVKLQENAVTTEAQFQAGLAAARAQKRAFILALVDPKVHTKVGPEWVALRVSDD